ncbi:MAG: NAD(P)H-hydrate dehydratase, partial [Candidatus Heimdallarchaeota archaeon]|nr:NAD(P)H-hydrate dehydratase [Candidatus Heimdallarchaeota archaeon]
LVGPGIGTSSEAKFLFNSIFSLYKSKFINLPLVIDAEGLRLLKRIRNWWTALPKETVLTPHPGEMSDLCELSISEIQSSRIEAASLFAEKWQKTIVLKGAITIIADPKGNTYSIPVATPALSTAGTGDTLAGLIAGFLAQGMQATEASLLSTSIHAKAGLLAEEEFNQNYSPTAGIILKKIPEAISYLKKQAPI